MTDDVKQPDEGQDDTPTDPAASDPIERHPGSLSGQDEPQDETHELGVSEHERAARALVEEWEEADLDRREELLACIAKTPGGPGFADRWRNGSVDYRADTLAQLRTQLGYDDE